MKMNINELETADYDILENIKVALYRLWKMKIIVILMTIIGFLFFGVYVGLVGIKTTYYTTASIYSAVYGSYEDSIGGITVMNQNASMLGSTRVCDRAASSLKDYGITSNELRSMVSSGKISLSGASASMDAKTYGTNLTLIVDVDRSDCAVEIANAMAKAFSDEINDLLGVSTLQVMDEAISYVSHRSINLALYFILFGIAAFVGTSAVIFVKEFFSSKVYSVAQCEQDERFVLGMIPYNEEERM